MDKLISQLLENGIYLSKIGEKLNIEFNSDSIPDELLQKIKELLPAYSYGEIRLMMAAEKYSASENR